MAELEGAVIGTYSIKHLLGRGGMADVYLAYDSLLQRDVAFKLMTGYSHDFLARFRREAEAIDKLQHEHILPAYDYEESALWHYLVMMYVPGGTLYDLIEQGPLSLEETSIIFTQIADAVQYAHDNGVLHRDIKPSNILMLRRDYAYLADFGLAKDIEHQNNLTLSGTLMGTPEYMAPDLAHGPASTATDVYALGVVLYQMLTGYVPFDGDTPVSIFWKHLLEIAAPPSRVNPLIPPRVDRVVMRALVKDAEKRYATPHDLAVAYLQAISTTTATDTDSDIRYAEAGVVVQQLSASPHREALDASDYLDAADYLEPLSPSSAQDATISSIPYIAQRRRTAGRRRARSQGMPPRARAGRMRYHNAGFIVTPGVFSILLVLVVVLGYLYYTRVTTAPTFTAQVSTSGSRSVAGVLLAPASGPGKIILQDSMANNNSGRWSEAPQNCAFTNHAYQVIVEPGTSSLPCALITPLLSDATVSVDVSLISGNSTGILLRLHGDQYYDYQINSGGQFFFRRHGDVSGSGRYTYLIRPTASSALKAGSASNQLMISARGTDFKLYINGIFVREVHDASYGSGQLAFTASSSSPKVAAIGSFQHVKITL